MNKETAVKIYKQYLHTKLKVTNDKGEEKEVFPMDQRLAKKMFEFDEKMTQNQESSLIKEALSPNFKGRLLTWSDTHFYHNNIIKYCDRPFEESMQMNDQLIRNYLDTVTDNDIVIWAGDTSFGKSHRAQEFLKSKNLPGRKLLILGNHDFEKGSNHYRDMDIFDEVSMCESFEYPMEIDGKAQKVNIFLSHYPLDDKTLPLGFYNFHGHIHDQQKGLPWVNLGVEVLGYKPVLLSEAFSIAKSFVPDPNKKLNLYGAV